MKTIKKKITKLKLELAAIYLAYKRKDTPLAAKIAALAAVGYALSPIDLIPDFIPVLGYVDDFVILPILIAIALKLIPEGILAECRAGAEGLWKDGRPRLWRYAVPVVLIWVIAVFVAVKIVVF